MDRLKVQAYTTLASYPLEDGRYPVPLRDHESAGNVLH